MAMVQFKCGEYSGFKALQSYEQGTIYVTTDEQGIYFAKDANTAVKLGNIITYNTLKGFTDSTKPPYSSDVFYYITESNALIKYNGTKFVQLNSASAEDISDIRTIIGSQDDTTTDTIWGSIKKVLTDIDAMDTSLSELNQTLTDDYAKKTDVSDSIDDAKEEVIGTSNDNKAANTVYGAKAYADDVKSTVIGTSNDNKAANTVYGAKAYAKDQIDQLSTTVATLSNNIGNLSNIMNFRGTFDSTSDVADPVNGDVIIVNQLEYVYIETSNTWEPFGTATADETRFQAIEKAAAALTERVTALDKDEGRVHTLETYVAAHKTEFSELANRVTALDKDNGKIATIETDIETINSKIGDVPEDKNLYDLLTDETDRAIKKENELSQAITDVSSTASSALSAALTWGSF